MDVQKRVDALERAVVALREGEKDLIELTYCVVAVICDSPALRARVQAALEARLEEAEEPTGRRREAGHEVLRMGLDHLIKGLDT